MPMYSWLNRWASWLANCMTLRARSVNRSYIRFHLLMAGQVVVCQWYFQSLSCSTVFMLPDLMTLRAPILPRSHSWCQPVILFVV